MNQWTRISIAGCLVLALGCGSDDDPVADDGTAATGAETTGGDTDTTGGGDTTTGDTDGGTTGDGTADGDDSGTTDGEPTEDQQAILDVEETKAFAIPGLKNEVHVLRTEHDIPHIYATDRLDLGHAVGFLLARDRYFVMDLARRLGNGNISSLLGDVAIENDVESRLMGMDVITQQMRDNLDADTEAYLAAVAAGINTYIAHVKAGDLPGPSELDLAGPLLGADNPADLMEEFTVRDLCATGTAVLFNLNYETDDVGRTAKAASLPTAFEGQDKEELRKESFLQDMWFNERPIFPGTNSMPGFGLDTAEPAGKPGAPIPEQSWAPQNRSTNLTMLNRLATRLQGWQDRRKRDRDKGYGSNTWAVNADKTADGWALVAGDGHLSLSVPALFWRMGFDTTIMGGGDLHQVGMLITGMYVMSVGTNGHVGFSGVNPVADITDWYREEIQLDSEGAPAATMFQGEWKPLSEHEETFEIADIPALSSVGRTEVHKRWVTFDGRWLRDIEGRAATADEALAAGETLVNLGGDWVVPGDEDGDGVVTAVSFDFTGFDVAQWLKGNDLMGRAKDVTELRAAAKYTTGGSLYLSGADSSGSIMFTSYQGYPCRGYLERLDSGEYAPGSDPKMLLDGTVYGGFELPTIDGLPDETVDPENPYRCIMPYAEVPQAEDPEKGYVFGANNDPAGITDDGKLHTAEWHIGGPWASVRASSIDAFLAECTADKSCDLEGMKALQAHRKSRMGELFLTHLTSAIDTARGLSETDSDLDEDDARFVALYEADKTRFDAVQLRLQAWADAGFDTPSGVVTFYHPEVSEQQLKDSVATMIYNAWQPRYIQQVYNDEAMPGHRHSGDRVQFRMLRDMLESRGPDNPLGLAAWDPETQEGVWFDRRDTPNVTETSDELMLVAMTDGLNWLEEDFATTDMDAWLWGLKHQAKFESLIGDFLPAGSSFSFITDLFSIDTETLPLADEYQDGDPRADLRWFPRGGDKWAVDAANFSGSGTSFTYGSGPVMRMVIALKDGEVRGENMFPGGQSSLTDSEHYADQAGKWLGNQTTPMRFTLDEVLEATTGRERLHPAE